MNNFEGLHPIMTAHYTLDWLTKFKLTDVAALQKALMQPDDITDTSEFVNAVMRNIMSGKQLCWGIGNHAEQLIGVVIIDELTQPTVDVSIKIAPQFKPQFNADEVRLSITNLLSGIDHQVGTWR